MFCLIIFGWAWKEVHCEKVVAVVGDFRLSAGLHSVLGDGDMPGAVAGRVLKTMRPGDPGTKRWLERYGRRLVAVRYRGDKKARKRVTTIELVVDEGFWDPEGFQSYKKAFAHV